MTVICLHVASFIKKLFNTLHHFSKIKVLNITLLILVFTGISHLLLIAIIYNTFGFTKKKIH